MINANVAILVNLVSLAMFLVLVLQWQSYCINMKTLQKKMF